jgi:DNA-binding NarL/FixJ family response regulator
MGRNGSGILIVEDEPLVALGMSVSLEKAGFKVVGVVASAAQAYDSAARLRPGMVLMDITLRGPTDGIEAARLLQEHFGIPVLFVTGQADTATKTRALAATKACGYLLKPFSGEQLTDAVSRAIDPGAWPETGTVQ